ncbi:hypothetical protein, partial [Acetobacter oeni]
MMSRLFSVFQPDAALSAGRDGTVRLRPGWLLPTRHPGRFANESHDDGLRVTDEDRLTGSRGTQGTPPGGDGGNGGGRSGGPFGGLPPR